MHSITVEKKNQTLFTTEKVTIIIENIFIRLKIYTYSIFALYVCNDKYKTNAFAVYYLIAFKLSTALSFTLHEHNVKFWGIFCAIV